MHLLWSLLRELWNNDAWEGSYSVQLKLDLWRNTSVSPRGRHNPPTSLPALPSVSGEASWQLASMTRGLLAESKSPVWSPGNQPCQLWGPMMLYCTEPSVTFLQHTSIILGLKWLQGEPRLTCLQVSSRTNPFLQVVSIPLQRILNASIHSGTRCLHSSHQERTCLLLLQFPINGEQLEAFQVNSPYRRFTHSKQKLGANSSTRNQINKLWCSHISVKYPKIINKWLIHLIFIHAIVCIRVGVSRHAKEWSTFVYKKASAGDTNVS